MKAFKYRLEEQDMPLYRKTETIYYVAQLVEE